MKRLLIFICPVLLITGCTVKKHKQGITEYYIIGFGKVTQQEYPEARATQAEGLGILIKSEPAQSVTIGYAKSQTVSVKPGSGINIQLQDQKGLPLIHTTDFQQPIQEQNHEKNACYNPESDHPRRM